MLVIETLNAKAQSIDAGLAVALQPRPIGAVWVGLECDLYIARQLHLLIDRFQQPAQTLSGYERWRAAANENRRDVGMKIE